MARTILVTGGVSSGKSRWAITRFGMYDKVLFMYPKAEMDTDTARRVEYETQKNYVEWDMHLGVDDNPQALFDNHKFAIFDSLSDYTKLVMERMCPDISELTEDLEKEIERKIIDDVVGMHDMIKLTEGEIVVISLETGFSIIPEDARQEAYRRILGKVNQRVANISSDVYLSVSGIQFAIK